MDGVNILCTLVKEDNDKMMRLKLDVALKDDIYCEKIGLEYENVFIDELQAWKIESIRDECMR